MFDTIFPFGFLPYVCNPSHLRWDNTLYLHTCKNPTSHGEACPELSAMLREETPTNLNVGFSENEWSMCDD